MEKNKRLLLIRHISIFSIILLSALFAHYKVLEFGFWKDDWISYWGAKIGSSLFYAYWFHPGTTIEFVIFSKVFPPNTVHWQIVGLFFRSLAAYGVFIFVHKVSQNFQTGLFSGLLYAVSPLSLDAVGWASIHVVHIDVFFSCLTLSIAWEYKKNSRRFIGSIFFVFLVLTFIIDPFRILPLLAFVLFFFRKEEVAFLRKRSFSTVFVLLAFMLFILIVYAQLPRIKETSIFGFAARSGANPLFYIQKIYLVKNYFYSVGNLIIGTFVKLDENVNTGTESKTVLLFSLLIFIFTYTYFHKKENQRKKIFIFTALMFIFYIPSWLSEPRLVMGATHRYMALSAIGWIGIVSIVLSNFSTEKRFLTFFLVLVLSVVTSQKFLKKWHEYRQRGIIENLLNKMDAEVPKNNKRYVFLIQGNHEILNKSISFSGAAPFATKKSLPVEYFPIVVRVRSELISYACKKTRYTILGQGDILEEKYPISSMYSWQIESDGRIISTTQKDRKYLLNELNSGVCDL